MIKNLLIAASLSFALYACGGADCESLCEDAKACDGADQEVDCAAQCEEASADAETAGCSDQYDDLISCQGDVEDICADNSTACTTEGAAAVACVLEFCTENPDDALCSAE